MAKTSDGYARDRIQLTDVAKQAGVSPAVVSRVLNSDPSLRIREATRNRVLQAARELAYTPHGPARALRSQRTGAIGLVMHDLSNPVYAEIVLGAQSAASSTGNVVLLADADELATRQSSLQAFLAPGRIDGVIVQAGGYAIDGPLIQECALHVPTVQVTSAADPDIVSVSMDDHECGRLATEFLLSMGHTKIAYITGQRGAEASQGREAGWRSALIDAGIEASDQGSVEGGWDHRAGHEAIVRVLSRADRPTAVVVANVLVASGVLRGARDMSFDVPGDLSVIAIHDAWFAETTHPRLTTLRTPLRELGAAAVDTLGALIAGEAQGAVCVRDPRPELVIRESTARLTVGGAGVGGP